MMDEVALKWALIQISKKLDERPEGGIKTVIEGKERVITYAELREEFERLRKAAQEERLKVVTFCKDCRAYSGNSKAPHACCFPKRYTSSRFAKDFCSLYEDENGTVRRGLY